MSAQFHYEGSAYGVAGVFEAPAHLVIPAEPSVSLSSMGGRCADKSEHRCYGGLLSIGLAACAINGGLNDSQTAWEIAMTSSIEHLDLLDGQVKADRIVARLVLHQDLHSDQPHIVALGSHIVNLRISGSPVGVELDPLTLTQFNSYDVLAKAAVVGKSTRKVSAVSQEQASSEGFVISLVTQIKCDDLNAVGEGHTIHLKGFGELHLAEMLVTPSSRQLTMLRISLQSSTRAELVFGAGSVGGHVTHRPSSSRQPPKVTLPLGSTAEEGHFMGDISLKDLLYKVGPEGPIGGVRTVCPRCGFRGVETLRPVGDVVPAWPSPADLDHHLDALGRLKVYAASQLLNTRPFELLRSSNIPLENLAAYFEAARYWFAREAHRVQALLSHRGWSDRAIEAISSGLALRLAALFEEKPQGDRFEVTVQMADVLPLERVIDMQPRERLELRQNHARRTQADLIGTLELGDNHTRVWLSNQFIASLNVEQIRRVAENPAVRSVSPTLPFEACIDVGLKRVSATTLLSNYSGKGQIVALLDSGIDDSHPDLSGAQVVHKKDYTGKGHLDQHGHGTHLAGIIASRHSQYKGVAPKSTIWSYRVLDENGKGSSHKQLVQALQNAVQDAVIEAKQSGQKIIINCSCAVPRSARTWGRDYEPVCDAFDAATSDAIVNVAAGNQGPVARSITAPGGGAAVTTVGASVDRPGSPYNFVANYSSRGPAIHRRGKPDIVAPGGLKNLKGDVHEDVSMVSSRTKGVWAKDQSDQKPWLVDSDHHGASGTSQATALVSGICALLLEELSQRKLPITHARVAQALKDTALNLGYPYSEQGHGLVQADEAMKWFR